MNSELKSVKEIIKKEIKYLLQFYPYNIKRFIDTKLLHASSILTFIDNKSKIESKFLNRIINLMAGIELLAVGVNLHSFNPEDFSILINNLGQVSDKVDKSGIEKNYTLDLLFGDIFYSRAVIYILRYGDFHLFNSILDSLKSVHKSRLFLLQKLVETINRDKDSFKELNKIGKHPLDYEKQIIEIFEENEGLITGMNSLLKTSFFIGWGIFADDNIQRFPYDILMDFIFLKTFNDLEIFFTNLPGDFYFLKNIPYIKKKKQFFKEELNYRIKNLKSLNVKNNFKSLMKLYEKKY